MMSNTIVTFLVLASMTLAACTSNSSPAARSATPGAQKETKVELKLTSTAFKEGQPIPRQYTCDGVNISPPLEWTGMPSAARAIAIIADDPDAPNGTWVHWVLYNLPAENIGLVENVPASDSLKAGGYQGKTDFGKVGYGVPAHRQAHIGISSKSMLWIANFL